MTEKKIFNQDSKERFEEAKMINGNPNGIFNFNKTPHSVARSIYKKMCNRTWFPEQVNISKDKINYSTLTPKEKKAYDLVLAQLITNDSIQVNQLMDKINSYITSPIVNAALARQAAEECYIEGTEVLTAEGFKGFENLKETDLVANYNEDGTITFTKPKHITKRTHSDIIYKFIAEDYTQIVTPGHMVVSIANDGSVVKKEAKDIDITDIRLPVSGKAIGSTIELSPKDALAIAWQIHGGHAPNELVEVLVLKGFCYKWRLKSTKHIDRMRELIKLTNYQYAEIEDQHGYNCFYIWVDRMYDRNLDWVTLIDKHSLWFMSFIKELHFWNNAPDDSEKLLYKDNNLKALAKVQAIAALCGSRTSPYWYKDKHNDDMCNLAIVLNKATKKRINLKKETAKYNGTVYCCTVESGMLVCRYKDSVFVSGNCVHSDSYAVIAEDICQNTDYIYNMHHNDEELKNKNYAVQRMYDSVYNENNEITIKDILKAVAANQILEGLIFVGGFAVLFSLENKMPGSTELVKEICKDSKWSRYPSNGVM